MQLLNPKRVVFPTYFSSGQENTENTTYNLAWATYSMYYDVSIDLFFFAHLLPQWTHLEKVQD